MATAHRPHVRSTRRALHVRLGPLVAKVTGPAVPAADLGDIHAVLLSHDHHGDNLDDTGRALLTSADTVLTRRVRAAATRIPIGTVLLHLGGVRFPVTGPLRYSMTARQAAHLCAALRLHTAIPVHYEGWHHFQEPRETIERAFHDAPPAVRDSIRWLTPGQPTTVTA
ncbi:MBL fold metallo-hydrolase [Micromonospora chokoriensis]